MKRLTKGAILFSGLVFFALLSCKNSDHKADSTSGEPTLQKNQVEHLEKPYVILVSIDGYRFDYTEKFAPPAITEISRRGVRAQSLQPVFPSSTFPNHYSIVTGRYSSNHGIVANHFYDPDLKDTYSLSNPNAVTNSKWYDGDPLWVVAERSGMLSASYFWVGSEAKINGFRPTYVKRYNHGTPNFARVAKVIEWLKLPPEQRPHFITLYFSSVDSAGHKFGTESYQLREEVDDIDGNLKKLTEQLDQLGLPINVFVVSDHGMQNLSSTKVEYLSDYISTRGINEADYSGAVIKLHIDGSSNLQRIYGKLKSSRGKFKVYKRSELPESFGYRNSKRVGDLVVVGEPGYYLYLNRSGKSSSLRSKATHGWDPQFPPMHGIFYAYGPNIKPLGTIESFENIHIYPLILKILGLSTPMSFDGDPQVLNNIYKSGPLKN